LLGYTVNISLIDTHPVISRKITLPRNITFKRLHEIIGILYGFEESNRYVFHIDDDIKLFEYSDYGYCYDDVSECKIDTYFNDINFCGYEYCNESTWLFKITIENKIDDVLIYPVVKSVKGKYNPSKIGDITTFNQLLLYHKNPDKYPIELYENELDSIEFIDKKLLQKRLDKLFNVENKKNTNVYVDSNYSLDKYLSNL
jgi:hypothetical protein